MALKLLIYTLVPLYIFFRLFKYYRYNKKLEDHAAMSWTLYVTGFLVGILVWIINQVDHIYENFFITFNWVGVVFIIILIVVMEIMNNKGDEMESIYHWKRLKRSPRGVLSVERKSWSLQSSAAIVIKSR